MSTAAWVAVGVVAVAGFAYLSYKKTLATKSDPAVMGFQALGELAKKTPDIIKAFQGKEKHDPYVEEFIEPDGEYWGYA